MARNLVFSLFLFELTHVVNPHILRTGLYEGLHLVFMYVFETTKETTEQLSGDPYNILQANKSNSDTSMFDINL